MERLSENEQKKDKTNRSFTDRLQQRSISGLQSKLVDQSATDKKINKADLYKAGVTCPYTVVPPCALTWKVLIMLEMWYGRVSLNFYGWLQGHLGVSECDFVNRISGARVHN